MNLPCHLVIVKGTEFFDAKLCKYVDMPVTDVLQMMGRAGAYFPQMNVFRSTEQVCHVVSFCRFGMFTLVSTTPCM